MENSLTYTMNGDYQIPDLKLTEQPEKPLGKYGRMRKAYLKEHRPLIYNQLLLTEKLYPHLIEIDETAQSRLEQMMPQLAKDAGATEQLKASDPMRWVGLMNTCKAQAEAMEKKNGWLLYPLGIALSGKARTPGGGTDLAAMLGREETLARLRAALAALG